MIIQKWLTFLLGYPVVCCYTTTDVAATVVQGGPKSNPPRIISVYRITNCQ